MISSHHNYKFFYFNFTFKTFTQIGLTMNFVYHGKIISLKILWKILDLVFIWYFLSMLCVRSFFCYFYLLWMEGEYPLHFFNGSVRFRTVSIGLSKYLWHVNGSLVHVRGKKLIDTFLYCLFVMIWPWIEYNRKEVFELFIT